MVVVKNQLMESNRNFDLPIKTVSMFTKPENAEHFDIVVIDGAPADAIAKSINEGIK